MNASTQIVERVAFLHFELPRRRETEDNERRWQDYLAERQRLIDENDALLFQGLGHLVESMQSPRGITEKFMRAASSLFT